jgi:DNA-binding NtrC family response regulator
MKHLSILVLDDERIVRDELQEFLELLDFNVYTASLPSEAIQTLRRESIDLAIFDIKMPEMDGITLLEKVKSEYPALEIMMISGHGEIDSVIDAMRKGAIDFFQKPINLNDVKLSLERTIKFIQLSKKLANSEETNSLLQQQLKEQNDVQIISCSKNMDEVLTEMSQVAKSRDTSVMITGESGTGKELVAKGIHALSERKDYSFHAVNCSAIPENLFESEFFGHKKGSFTGAHEDKAGWFEVADKGTLFLDEIGDMPINLQMKLLRVIEERTFIKVGTQKIQSFDIRIIAATNQKIKDKSLNGDFRLDLYHRLSTFEIHIPPLKERKEDIPLLVSHFTLLFASKQKKSIPMIEQGLENFLKAYSFPGNVRELRNIVERAIILCTGNTLRKEHFNSILKDETVLDIEQQYDLELVERGLIKKALDKSDHNKSQAAKMLNISWNALHRKMSKHHIN